MKLGAWVGLMIGVTATGAWAQSETRVVTVKPQYLPPAELARILGVHDRQGREVLEWRAGDEIRSVEVRRNDGANLLIFSGAAGEVVAAEEMIKAIDLPPRQVLLEAKIVEVNQSKAMDAGIDWPSLRASLSAGFRGTQRTSFAGSGGFGNRSRSRDEILDYAAIASIGDALKLLQESGAATFRDAPRILTVNNRRATILDGQRVTYVTRYSSYANLFETDTLDAGLTLSVLPSLGESGYLTLDIRAELTSLSSNISGSPVKDGQIVENTVVVKDGQTVVLGGFQRTVVQHVHRRFPVLGYVLPFLFSRKIENRSTRESFVVLTPRVVDLAAGLDERTRDVIEGR